MLYLPNAPLRILFKCGQNVHKKISNSYILYQEILETNVLKKSSLYCTRRNFCEKIPFLSMLKVFILSNECEFYSVVSQLIVCIAIVKILISLSISIFMSTHEICENPLDNFSTICSVSFVIILTLVKLIIIS